MVLSNLGGILAQEGKLAEAQPLLERALVVTENTLGSEHPTTNEMRANSARLLLRMGRPTEALAFAQTALAAQSKLLGSDHSSTKYTVQVTAAALDALGRTEDAKALRGRYGLTRSDDPKPS
jgi:tetratricopeptide (TPR) repeat protein